MSPVPIDGFAGDFSAGGPFFSPFWAIYGYVEPGALAQGRGTALFAPAFMWLYLLLSLVLFVNLLIAIFNDTYASVQAEKSQIWKYALAGREPRDPAIGPAALTPVC